MDLSNVFGLPQLADKEVGRLRAHVAGFAAQRGLEWREGEMFFLQAEGDFGDGWFASPTIRTELDYLIGLHEAGHHVLDLPTFDPVDGTVIFDNEVAVWRWVRQTALVDVSYAGWKACITCLNTHGAPPAHCLAAMRALLPEIDAPMRWR